MAMVPGYSKHSIVCFDEYNDEYGGDDDDDYDGDEDGGGSDDDSGIMELGVEPLSLPLWL